MQIDINKVRPPIVRWEEMECGFDVEAGKKAGHPVPRVVVMAIITPAGSRDEVHKPAEEWLKQINEQALRGEYPVQWVQFFRHSFEEYQKGNELPREGTPIKTWAMLSGQQMTVRRMLALGITTVEDLAEIPDSGLGTIGIDGRFQRDQARGWINEAKDKGINAKAIADANVKIEDQQRKIEDLTALVNKLSAKIEAREEDQPAPRNGKGRGRQPEEALG